MLEILVGLATLWILKRRFPNAGAADGKDAEIVPFPFIHHQDRGDGAPFSFVDDDFDSDCDTALIDEILDEGGDDEFIE
ncbi:hypothetical protein [Desulfatitalea alkaliphila]|uniref:Uncharacterized protein n=1 Tax=Desulfatitalea alkaliphila TaxID=2929485 RepID=A0AA41R1G3_9BACT|nr:hypothetical protein [Desulfatitalea alkaliphila]MCJ8500689.1 hypothetical protein [Desulfatitalea alkaliphila]